jgi:hypothetical protein
MALPTGQVAQVRLVLGDMSYLLTGSGGSPTVELSYQRPGPLVRSIVDPISG